MRKRLEVSSMKMLWALLIMLVFHCSNAKKQDCYSSCGSLHNITFPFRLKEDPKSCGRPGSEYEISCENNRPVLYLNSRPYYVKEISYELQTIRVVDSVLRIDDCSSLSSFDSSLSSRYGDLSWSDLGENMVVFVNCSLPVEHPSYVATDACLGSSGPHAYMYAIVSAWMSVSNLNDSCEVAYKVRASAEKVLQHPNPITTYSEIHKMMIMMGFKLNWVGGTKCKYLTRNCWKTGECDATDMVKMRWACYSCERLFESYRCFFLSLGFYLEVFVYYALIKKDIVYFLLGRAAIGMLCLFIFLAYKLRRKHIWMDTTIEEFLTNYKCQMPTRYSYSDIKKMTRHFEEKLGQGGYGSVFKGKLSSGRLVAVKMLMKSKGNGQEFINEVATIGRIHHVNVVRLLGFCSEGPKRALIYEFMPNGSLEKYIFTQRKDNPLSWDKVYKIALGIAHGIEYLHRGCDMKILHFDIKPHNILLDEKFTPKVSDFGLAKFYPTDESIVSVTARGTIGYMAPELFYKNIGRVSYKSDVYSFGKLLMEMEGRRKNADAFAEHSSQIYFPMWIYDKLEQGEDMEIEDVADDDKGVRKKLSIVSLWCIQMNPIDRPSMSKVLEMLQESVEDLQMPPKPILSSPQQQMLDKYYSTGTEPAESSTTYTNRD